MKIGLLTAILSLGVSSGSGAQESSALFDSVVRSAIDKGRVFLLESLDDRSNELHWARAYPMGFRALVAYALMEAGTDPDHPIVVKLFKDLGRIKLAEVYSVSLYVMALDSAWRHQIAKKLRPNRRISEERMGGRLRSELKKCVAWLISARWPGKGTWGYGHWKEERVRNNWDDFSNTQFAVLALQVAMRHDVTVSSKVFSEVLAAFENNAWTGGEVTELVCQGPGWWDEPIEKPSQTGVVGGPVSISSEGLTLKATPQSWGYRPGFGGKGVPGQYSMVAAATSSLMVCRRGLADRLDANRRWDIDGLISGGIITLERRFRTLFPSGGDSVHRNYYYTLYSFEKAMDLGGISRLDGIDWYHEQAVVLTNDQRADGGWGNSGNGPEYAQISTSFALLFLKRATRHLRVEESGPIVTGPGAGEAESVGVKLGKVHVPSLGGTVDLNQVFAFLAEDRTLEYLELAKEILATIPPEEVTELLPYLARVRRGARDAVDRFAEKGIRDLSGLPGDSPEPRIGKWLESYRRVVAIGSAGAGTPGSTTYCAELIRRLADQAETLPMRLALVDALTRVGSLDAVDVLVACLAEGPYLRERAHRALTALTGRRFAYPDDESREGIAALVTDWEAYWGRHGESLRIRVQWETLRLALERANREEERARLADAIVALGSVVVPNIDEILKSHRFAFEWVIIRERITGERKGLIR